MRRLMAYTWVGIGLLIMPSHSATPPSEWIPFPSGKWGYIDPHGEITLPPQFDYAHCFSDEGIAIARSNKKCGYIDGNGDWLLPPTFLSCEHMAFGRAPVRVHDSGWVFVNKKGERLSTTFYREAYPFKPTGTASVQLQDSSWQLVDTHLVATDFKRKFSYLSDFLVADTAALACERVAGKDACGIIQKDGAYLSEVRNAKHVIESGLVLFGSDTAMGALQLPSDTLISPTFRFLKYASGSTPDEYRFWVKDSGQGFALIDRNMRIYAQGKWEAVMPYYKSATVVTENKNFGLVDSYTGKILLRPIYSSILESCPGYFLVDEGKSPDRLTVFDAWTGRFIREKKQLGRQ